MKNLPQTPEARYKKINKIGSNLNGTIITYLAIDNPTNKYVIIKELVKSNSSIFKTFEREIQVLNFLQYPAIPRYLNSFETAHSLCIVQEYKNALSLEKNSSFNLKQIQKIASDCLEILIYLQSRNPPVIHRNITPENILVDDLLNVYLVDFGFARIGSGEGSVNSVAAGTFGFMAPEQIYNKNISKATDIYGLGVTIICLLTRTKSIAISTLINDNGNLNFKHLLPKLEPSLVKWLEKMVAPKQEERYASAEAALIALKSLNFTLLPEVHLSQNTLDFNVIQTGEKVSQIITVTNSVPGSILEGNWQVVPHPNDKYARGSSHPWISFTPVHFKSNKIDCTITIDVDKLLADRVYEREILLETNSEAAIYKIILRIKVGKLALFRSYPILLFLSILLMSFLTCLASYIIVSRLISWKIYTFIATIIITWNVLTPINLFLIRKHRELLEKLVGYNHRLRYDFTELINLDLVLFASYLGGILFLVNTNSLKILAIVIIILILFLKIKKINKCT